MKEGRAKVVDDVKRHKNALRELWQQYKPSFMYYHEDYWKLVTRMMSAAAGYLDGEELRSRHDLSKWMLGHDIPEDREYCRDFYFQRDDIVDLTNKLLLALEEIDKRRSDKTENVYKLPSTADLLIEISEAFLEIEIDFYNYRISTIERHTYGGV